MLGTKSADPDAIAPRSSRARGLATWQVKRVLAYIDANIGSKMEIREIASVVVLSRGHFSRAFKQSLGCSPMMYVKLRRVERAKLMMTSTNEGLTDIALVCGFSDQPHLNKWFRRVVGVSPGVWRRRTLLEPTAVSFEHANRAP